MTLGASWTKECQSAPLLMITLTLKNDTLHDTFVDVFCYESNLLVALAGGLLLLCWGFSLTVKVFCSAALLFEIYSSSHFSVPDGYTCKKERHLHIEVTTFHDVLKVIVIE